MRRLAFEDAPCWLCGTPTVERVPTDNDGCAPICSDRCERSWPRFYALERAVQACARLPAKDVAKLPWEAVRAITHAASLANQGPQEARSTVDESEPEHPDPPQAKRINYRCSRCGVAEKSGEMPGPSSGKLRIYPLPPGWELVACPVLEEDDHVHCAVCVERATPDQGGGET